jgi:hypothetical protein
MRGRLTAVSRVPAAGAIRSPSDHPGAVVRYLLLMDHPTAVLCTMYSACTNSTGRVVQAEYRWLESAFPAAGAE